MVLVFESQETFPLLVIDDEPALLDLIPEILRDMPLKVLVAQDAATGLRLLNQHQPRVVLLDVNLGDTNGMQLLEQIAQFDPGIEVIVLSGEYSPSVAVSAIQKGAADYLRKPVSVPALRARIERSIKAAQKNKRISELDAELLSSFEFHGIVGRSPHLLNLFNKMRRIAPHYRTVLISGASGTGKELVAHAIHDLSPARNGPFIVWNCAAMPESLAETEMFGYRKGSFTGALKDTQGLFERADGGTVFLDEIGEISGTTQAKLLRVLQTHEIQRVGSAATKKLNIRVIAATNRELRAEVAELRFREDLYYRLSVVHLQLPSLAERKEDLPLLQKYFVQKFAKEYDKSITGISRRAQSILSQHGWPGNVRELENVIARACMLCDGQVLDLAHFPPELTSEASAAKEPVLMTLKDAQQKYVCDVLRAVNGNKARAAEILGISRSTLHSLLPDN